jgi:hypothetical protein
VVINGKKIYPLINTKPVVISIETNNPKIVVTDGFHITKPVKLVYRETDVYCFKVTCVISDWQLYAGLAVLSIAYLAGMFTGILFLKLFCFLPLVYLLGFYYLNKEQFLRLEPVIR